MFHNNGAELQTAASFALARSQRHGLEGMAQGVTLIEALCSEWSSVWSPMTTVRLDILAWLFAQLQPLLRSLEITAWTLPALVRLDSELERLSMQLARQGQVPLVTLQALCHQVGGLIHRLERNGASGERLPISTRVPEPAFVMPVVILPAHPMPEVPPAASKSHKRSFALWLFAFFVAVALACGFGWFIASQQHPAGAEPVQLDSLSLFDAGSTELKAGSTKVLINALASIQAQSGWLIEIVGHTDTTGNAEQNLQISYAHALAVRDWMQRMGDIPDNCFAVQGAAGSQPITSNDTASGRAANRRVDIRLVPQVEACARPSTGY
ncbi:OmpA family protein [Pseudomonas frederiksbergensis]|uniref:OmpA family protein n=1 Tax=Pseudomonas frederiksbergensis TaxID=104087 RepID=UPI002E81628F|nr:OmpA family protein [Pseudomonas frederiksbergensis]